MKATTKAHEQPREGGNGPADNDFATQLKDAKNAEQPANKEANAVMASEDMSDVHHCKTAEIGRKSAVDLGKKSVTPVQRSQKTDEMLKAKKVPGSIQKDSQKPRKPRQRKNPAE